jgi:Ca2+-binding RTX toxin-like protein
MLEHLESRKLLAVTAGFSGGVLTVTGDDLSNRVVIGRNAETDTVFVRTGDVTIASVPNSQLTAIKVSLLGEGDVLEIAGTVTKPATISGGLGNDRLAGGGGRDVIYGDAGNDTLTGGAGADALYGGEGNDVLNGGLQGDLMSGGTGIDQVTYGDREAGVRVTLDDVANDGTPATATAGAEGDNVRSDVERVTGGRGNDFLSAAPTVTATGTITPGRVTLEGGGGNDTLVGSNGGESPSSVLMGGDGNDSLVGGSKNDSMNGGGGNDTLRGNDGNDSLDGGAGADLLSGGGGSDLVTYATRTAGVVVSIDGVANDGQPAAGTTPAENDNVLTDVERLAGGAGNDRLTGSDAANTIGGGAGNDTIFGLGGNDAIEGSAGNDVIWGGAGSDSLYGGPGADQLYGEAGEDSLFARGDVEGGLRDSLDGGDGYDRGTWDDLDIVVRVEQRVV